MTDTMLRAASTLFCIDGSVSDIPCQDEHEEQLDTKAVSSEHHVPRVALAAMREVTATWCIARRVWK